MSEVNFEDFEGTVRSLASMPLLKSLYISLQEEGEVDLIIRTLPGLEFLNGLPVDRESLEYEGEEDDGRADSDEDFEG